ncbi:MAG: hypothetical protein ABIL06_16725, partial [Pseudomonadota bacterium]
NIGECCRIRHHLGDIDGSADVCAAVANENTYSKGHCYLETFAKRPLFPDFCACPVAPEDGTGVRL